MPAFISFLTITEFTIFGLPEDISNLIFMVLGAAIFCGVSAVMALLGVYLERKISAKMQDRLGPMEVGSHGILQTLADAVKLLLKEDIVPAAADKTLHFIAPVMIFAATLAAFAVLQFSEGIVFSDLNVGIFYIIAISSFVVIAIILAGWSSNNKWSLLGGMRAAAQIVSFEIPASLAVMVVVMSVGSLNLGDIIDAQEGSMFSWMIFRFFPFNFIAFIVFFVASLAELNRAPFDMPEAESEIVAGFATEYSGFKWSCFFLAEYANMFLVSVVITTLFLGGWRSPFGDFLNSQPFQLFWLLSKAFVIIFIQMWLRWTLPRVRVDQLMYTSWKVLTPFAFVAMIGVGLLMIL